MLLLQFFYWKTTYVLYILIRITRVSINMYLINQLKSGNWPYGSILYVQEGTKETDFSMCALTQPGSFAITLYMYKYIDMQS